ncbi:MAG TPA: EamA family transporter [Candidatus Dormibacteraeota bacterium]|nr:EamA family transporter [Candidatus Dormibacteraeota bacterium]
MPAIAFATLIFGTTFVVIRAVLVSAGIWTLLADRFLIAAAVGIAVLAVMRRVPTPDEWRWGLVLGVIAAAMQATNTIGLETTTASNSAFICAGYIALVPFVGWLAMRLIPTPIEIAAAGAALVGTALLALRWPLDHIVPGDLWTVGTAVTAALSIVATKMAVRTGRPLVLVVIQSAVVAAACAAGAALSGEGFTLHGAGTVTGTLYLGTVASLGAFALAAYGQRYVSPSAASVVFGLEPLVATVLGAMALGERLGPLQAVGGSLMLAAGWAVASYDRRARRDTGVAGKGLDGAEQAVA